MLEIAIKASIIAFVYAVILTQPGEIFYHWILWIQKLTYREKTEAFHWTYKIMVGCEKCIAGQICFWWYLIRNFQNYSHDMIIQHAFTICLGIFFTIIIKKIYIECQR